MSALRRVVALPSGRATKWVVLAFWIIIVAAAGPLAGKLTGAQENDASSWLPGSAESTAVLDLQERFRSSDTLPTLIVYERTSGITQADQAQAADDVRELSGVERVTGDVEGPIPAEDGQALQVVVPIDMGDDGWEKIGDVVGEIEDVTGAGGGGLDIHISGPAGTAADSAEAFEGIDTTLLLAAATVVIIILLLTYRSPILWLLPVISALVALSVAQGVVYLLAEYADLTVNAQSAGILLVLVFGAGTDYALLLVARYREELRRHEDRHDAMARALRRAGPAIVASGATVAVSMLVLLVADMNSTQGMGPVAAIGITVGVLVMMSLLPALLVIVGRWVFWPIRPRYGSAEPSERGLWARLGRVIARRPRTVWVATGLVLGTMALGLTNLKTGVLSNEDAFIDKPDSVVGQEVLAQHFPAGAGQPVIVISRADHADQVRDAFAATPGIDSAAEPVTGDGYAYIEGTLADSPDSDAARETVERVRESVHGVDGGEALVGGDTAIMLDAADTARRDQNVIIPLVLVAVFIILALLLRAILAPLLLVATVVLSFAAALGVSALVFDHVFGFAGADTSFPLFVFVFLVALGIDYNIFLMSRVREEAVRHGTRRGTLVGLSATGGVITSAGLVLAGTFAAFATLPLVIFAEIGFAIAFGVLLDTIVVRAVLVTALNLDIGRRIWWPSKLAAKHDDDAGDTSRREAALVR